MARHGREHQGIVENSRKHGKISEDGGRWQVATGDDGGTWGMVGDDTMLSVLVLGSYLPGKFRKRRDGTTKFPPSWALTRTHRSEGISALIYGCSYSRH